MSTETTTPIPMERLKNHPALWSRIKPYTESSGGIGSCAQETSTDWKNDIGIFQTPKNEIDIKTIREFVLSLFFQALAAEANDEITRPLLLRKLQRRIMAIVGESYCPPGQTAIATIIEPSPRQESREPAEQSLDQAEFVWSESLYQARKAALEFSKETHADY